MTETTIVPESTKRPLVEGWLWPDEWKWLFEMGHKCMFIAEIGSWKGLSSRALAVGCKGRLYCIDHFQGSVEERDNNQKEAKETDIELQFRENMKDLFNWYLLRMASLDAVKNFEDGSMDMVFIDGGHGYEEVKADIQAWLPKVRMGGLLCGHDLDMPGVQGALLTLHLPFCMEVGRIWAHRPEWRRP